MGVCVSIRRSDSCSLVHEDGPASARPRMAIQGFFQSIQERIRRSRSGNDQEAGDGQSIRFRDVELGPELLIQILSHVPDLELIKTCRLVCQHWKSVVDDDQTWIKRAERRGHIIPEALKNRKTIPKHTFQKIAMMNPFGRNLIRNPYGEDQLKGWKNAVFGVMGDFTSTNSYGWTIEDPPQGVSSLDLVPVIRNQGYTSCFATSHFRCAKDQRIDLYKEGITKEMMEELQPDIAVGEWHTASLEYGTTYWLLVEILDYAKNVVEQFRYVYKKSAGKPLPWTKVGYVFPRHRRIRYIRFYHESVITEYLQNNDFPEEHFVGQQGNKMTGATVIVWLQCESAAETDKRNSKDENLYSLAFGPKEGYIINKSIEHIFIVKTDQEDFSSNLNLCDWSLAKQEPEDSKKLPEVRYLSVIHASRNVEACWIQKEDDDEQEENVLYN